MFGVRSDTGDNGGRCGRGIVKQAGLSTRRLSGDYTHRRPRSFRKNVTVITVHALASSLRLIRALWELGGYQKRMGKDEGYIRLLRLTRVTDGVLRYGMFLLGSRYRPPFPARGKEGANGVTAVEDTPCAFPMDTSCSVCNRDQWPGAVGMCSRRGWPELGFPSTSLYGNKCSSTYSCP